MALNYGFRCIHRIVCHGLLKYNVRYSSSSIRQLLQTVPGLDTPVTVHGWVRAVRTHKEVVFLHINDGSSLEHLQIVSANDHNFPPAATYGSCVKVSGSLIKSSQPKQAVEVKANSIEVLGECDFKSYPFKAHKYHTLDYVRQFPHLRPRTLTFGSLLRVRNAATLAVHKYFQKEGFCVVHTPILTSNDCEGAGEVFTVEPLNAKVVGDAKNGDDVDDNLSEHFFGLPTFLTVSGQLHLEVVAGAFSKVYTFGPTFRAENSRTRHHLAEFSMIEAEMAFTESLDDIIKVVEGLLKYTTQELLSACPDDVSHVRQRSLFNVNNADHTLAPVELLLSKPFVRLTYTEAIKVLSQNQEKFHNKVEWGIDLYKEHERFLVEHCGNGVPVFVTDYPTKIKPFYARKNSDAQTVAAVDLLAPGVGEICGGSLREERILELEQRIASTDVNLGNLDWYLDLRRFGSAPHGGFGIGFERYIQSILGIQNIRDTIPFPRTANSCRL